MTVNNYKKPLGSENSKRLQTVFLNKKYIDVQIYSEIICFVENKSMLVCYVGLNNLLKQDYNIFNNLEVRQWTKKQ